MTPDCFMCQTDAALTVHGSLVVHPNYFPIHSLHLLLVAATHRESLQPYDLESAADFLRLNPQFLIFHNMRSAGASRPEHMHFQVVPNDQSLPLLAASCRTLFQTDGATINRIENHPAYALSAEGVGARDAVFNLIESFAPSPFNLVMTAERIFIVPRAVAIPRGFSDPFGGLEMSGRIVLADENHYHQLSYDSASAAMAECGFDAARQTALELKLAESLSSRKKQCARS